MAYLKLIAQTSVVGRVIEPIIVELKESSRVHFLEDNIVIDAHKESDSSIDFILCDDSWQIKNVKGKTLKNGIILPSQSETDEVQVAFEKVKKCLVDCLERFQNMLGFKFRVEKEVQTFKEFLEICERYYQQQCELLSANNFLGDIDSKQNFEELMNEVMSKLPNALSNRCKTHIELKRSLETYIEEKKGTKPLFVSFAEDELSSEQLSHFALLIENHQKMAEAKPPVSIEESLVNIQMPSFDTLDEAYFYFRDRLASVKDLSRLQLGDVFQFNNWQIELNYQNLKGNEETPLTADLSFQEIDEFIEFAARDKNVHKNIAAYLEEKGDSSEQAKLSLYNEFRSMRPVLREIIRKHGRILHLNEGSVAKPQVLCRQGDYGNTAYYVASGSLQVLLNDQRKDLKKSQKKKTWVEAFNQIFTSKFNEVEHNSSRSEISSSPLKGEALFMMDMDGVSFDKGSFVKNSGEIIGEISAMGRSPRVASIVATENVSVLELRWQGLRELRERLTIIRDITDASFSKHGLDAHLRATDIFKHLKENENSFKALKTACSYRRFGDFSWHGSFKSLLDKGVNEQLENEPVIISEGEYPDGLFLIRSGFVRVSQKENHGHKTLSYLAKGAVYGLEELKHNFMNPDDQRCHHYSVRSLGYSDVIFVPKDLVEELLFKDPNSIHYCEAKESKRRMAPLEVSATLQDARSGLEINQDLADALVDKRVINGSAAMMINLDRCTRCDDCVVACADNHEGNPRFIRHGQKALNFMIANACMHCNDPVCMIGCPTGAIHRDQGEGQVLINDSTCIGCATCANGCPYNNIRMVDFPEATTAIPQKATKCDLCYDQLGGPACERACPHEALLRVNLSDSMELENWFQINEGKA